MKLSIVLPGTPSVQPALAADDALTSRAENYETNEAAGTTHELSPAAAAAAARIFYSWSPIYSFYVLMHCTLPAVSTADLTAKTE